MNTKIRIKFSKGDEVRFLSHLDLMRTVERAVRRAEIPIAFSEGFHPKPRFSFASALATGITSDGEYADFILEEKLKPEQFKQKLNEQLPTGIRVLEAVEVPMATSSLMAAVNLAKYLVTLRILPETVASNVSTLIDTFITKESSLVQRTNKGGEIRTVDIRPLVYQIVGHQEDNTTLSLNFSCATGSKHNVRPEEVVQAILGSDGQFVFHREGLYILNPDRTVVSPLEAY